MAKSIRWILATLFLLGSVTPLFGQATASASIEGTVTDPSKAVVSGANVTITHKETGTTRSATTSNNGAYRFDLLPAGNYSVKVAKAGFQTATVTTIDIPVGRTVTVDVPLKLGSESQTVEVTGEAPMVDQQKTDVALSIAPTDIDNMPLNGRDFGNLAYLAPGARPVDSYDPTKNRVAVFSVDGGAGRNVNVTVNGIDNKDNTVGGPVMQFPLEAIQEFNISTQRFSAANGRSEVAAINVITKSGTNNYHGSAYYYGTRTGLNSTDFFSAQNNTKRQFDRDQFGGSIGGPVRKDKDFLFFALERLREHTALAVSEAAYNDLVAASVAPINAEPATSLPTPYFDWRYTGRYDHSFNSKHNVYFTYSAQSNNGQNDQATQSSDLLAGNTTTNELILANFTVNSVLSNNIVNTFTSGFQYWNNKILAVTTSPYFTFTSGANSGTNPNVPQQSYQRKWQFKDDVAISKGAHGLKFGVDYLWEPQLGGYFKFNSTLEVDFSDTAVNLANPALYPQGFSTPGVVQGMTIANGDPYEDLPGGAKMLGLYFQDDWKANKRLTLNLGVRYDKDYNLIGGGAQSTSRTYQMLKQIGSPYASGLPKDGNLDFSPRFGFSFDLTGTGKHLLRGGYGLYFGQTFLNIPLFMIQQANPTIFATAFSLSDPAEIVPGTGIPLSAYRYGVDPLPTVPPPATQLTDGATGRLMDPGYRNPYTQQWNVGYSWAIDANNVIEAEFVHTLGLHESKTVNINPQIPGAGGVRVFDAAFADAELPILGRIDNEESIDRSRYDGLNISYRRRMSKHFSVNSSYVLSRAVCYRCYLGAASFRNRPFDPYQPLNGWDHGYAPSDERHRIVFSGVFDLGWGFQVSPILQWASARPYDPLAGNDIYGWGQGGLSRPVLVPSNNTSDLSYYQNLWASQNLTQGQIQLQVQQLLASGSARPVPYNSLRAGDFFNWDMRVTKQFKIKEKYNINLIAQFFDLTNRANFGGGNIDQGNGSIDGQVWNWTTVSGARKPAMNTDLGVPGAFFTPSGVIIPQAFRAEFGAEFRF